MRATTSGRLVAASLSERATKRGRYCVRVFFLRRGWGCNCQHYWASQAAKNTPLQRLQDAGGWSSYAMPLRYIESAKISNEGVQLPE